jgi:hypothetical protein
MAQQQSLPIGRKPTHRLYRVTGEGKSAFWTPIGAAWPNKDGEGFSLSCDLVPLQGRIVMRRITAREAAAEAGEVAGVLLDPRRLAMGPLGVPREPG